MAKSDENKAIVPLAGTESARGTASSPERLPECMPGRRIKDGPSSELFALSDAFYRRMVLRCLAKVLSDGIKGVLPYDVASIFSFEPVRSKLDGILHLAGNDVFPCVKENLPVAEVIDLEAVKSGLIQATATTLEIYKGGEASQSTHLCLAAPLLHEKRVLGVLVIRAQKETPYSAGDAVILGNLARQLVRALELMAKDDAGDHHKLANLGNYVFRIFPSMGNEKAQLTPEKLELENALKVLNLGVNANLLNAEWLLENFPVEFRSLASVLQATDKSAEAYSSQDTAFVKRRRAAALLPEDKQNTAKVTKTKPLSGPSNLDEASLPEHSPDESVQEFTPEDFFRWFDEHASSMSRNYLQQNLVSFSQAQQGKNFGSGKANSQFAKGLHARIKQLGLFVACPGSSGQACGDISYLRCKQRHPSYPTGAFYFEHADQEQTTHGWSSSVPALKFLGPDGKPIALLKKET
jgi:hypothetical protein